MKKLTLILLTAGLAFPQSAALTEAQYEKLVRLRIQVQLEEEKARLAMMPALIEQNALVEAACLRLGVPKAKIATECKVDPDPAKGNGFGEVRWEKPVPQKQGK